jgi:hypothetical protein
VGLVAGQTKVAWQFQLWLLPQVQSMPGNAQLPLIMPHAAPSIGVAAGQTKVSTQFHARATAAAPPLPALPPPALPPPAVPTGGPPPCARQVQRSPA